jgi:hypothetical protein
VTPLQQWGTDVASKRAHLFPPRTAWRMQGFTQETPRKGTGKNAPQGIVVNYWIGNDVKPGTVVKLAALAADGTVIRELQGELKSDAEQEKAKVAAAEKAAAQAKEPPKEPAKTEGVRSEGGEKEAQKKDEDEEDPEAKAAKERNKLPDAKRGFNRVAWNLRHEDAKEFEGMILWGGGTDGPRVPPGTYTIRLTVGDEVQTAQAKLVADPGATATPADLQAQYELLLGIRNKLTEVHTQIERIRTVRKQLADLRTRVGKDDSGKPIVEAAKALDKKMTTIEEALYQTKNRSSQDPLNFPIRLNDKLAALGDSVGTGDFGPTAQARAVYQELVTKIDTQLASLRQLWATDLPAINQLVKESTVPAIPLPKEPASGTK